MKVRIYDRPVCLLTAIEIVLQDNMKVRIYDKPVCLLTAIEILLQDTLKVRIYDRPVCLLIGFKLLLQENKIHKKDRIFEEMLIKYTIALIKLMQELQKYSLVYGSFFLRFPKRLQNGS